MSAKTAVVLFNLGGPSSLDAVQPFLFNLFNDEAIINLPQPARYLLAKFISYKRAPFTKKIYEKLNGHSPIIAETTKQAQALEKALSKHGEFKVFFTMRYWHPYASDVAQEVKEYDPDKIILLPLYPQFSASTTNSSIKQWLSEAKAAGLQQETKILCSYPYEPGFIKANTELIQEKYKEIELVGKPRILFSAHGLPVKMIKAGDPYQWQVEQSVQAIVDKLAINGLDYKICYQSKVGRLEWLSPSTEEEIIQAAQDRVPVVVVPIAFVSEHSETLVELDMEYSDLAKNHNIPGYARVPTVSAHKSFINGLAQMCLNAKSACGPDTQIPICPDNFTKCLCRA